MKTWKPTVAGILSIIAGAFSLIVGLAAVMRVERAARILFHWRLETMGSLAIVLGILAIIFVSLSRGEFTTTSISSPPAPPQPPSSPPAQSS